MVNYKLAPRLLGKVRINETSKCWEWTGYIMPNGYAQIGIGQKHFLTHRVSYETFIGPIPKGLTIDHLCRVRHCINPWHMEPVTNKVNTLRGTSPSANQARATMCKNGHPLSGPNLVPSRGRRKCRICANARRNKRYRENLEESRAKWRKYYSTNQDRYRRYYENRKKRQKAPPG